MTISGFLECSTCSNVIKVRYQVGYITPFKVRIGCKECGKVIKGEIDLKSESFNFGSDSYNQKHSEADQTTSISSELPISKLANEKGSLSTPFMSLGKVFGGFHNVLKFQADLKNFQQFYDESFSNYTMLNELLQKNSIKYLLEEAKKRFRDKLSLELFNFHEFSFVLNEITHDFFKAFYTDHYQDEFHKKIIQSLLEENKGNKSELNDLRDTINVYTNLGEEYKKGQMLLEKFLANIKSFLPVILLSYNNNFSATHGTDFTITTFDFQDLKDLYIEQFEFLARLSSLHFGLHNLAERGDFNDFGTIPDCSVLEDYQKRTNGSKKEVIKKSDLLNNYFLDTLNSQIRNGLGHLKTSYDPVDQIITFFPYIEKEKLDRSKTIFLIDFTNLVYQQALKVKDTQILIQKLYEYLDAAVFKSLMQQRGVLRFVE